MKLINAMVWWGKKPDDIPFGQEEIKILDVKARGNSRYLYLENSNGACCAGWKSMGAQRRAAAILAMVYDAIIRDRISPDDAHAELMKIDEYREWYETCEGPFADVYHGNAIREVDHV